MTHTRVDALMVGCLGAILIGNPRFRQALALVFSLRLPLVAIPFLLFVTPLLRERFGGAYQFLAGYTLEAVAIVLLLLWLVEKPHTPLGRLLNLRLIAHLGVISYSLYLWQELFTYHSLLWSLPATLLVAEFSFWVVERPFLRLREHMMRSHPRCVPSLVGALVPPRHNGMAEAAAQPMNYGFLVTHEGHDQAYATDHPDRGAE
jgi:peptidoglycan/LPS O-acetylase OafA/YrhL